MNRLIRAAYKRLGIIHLGRRRVRDLIDYIDDRRIDTVIDVGANVGQFGEGLRANGFRGKIVSFEPVTSVFQELAKKAAADGNWEAYRCGLGAVAGSAQIHVSELTVFSSILEMTSTASLHDSRTAVTRTEDIEIRTLDQVAAALTGKGLSRNAKLYLQGLASSSDRPAFMRSRIRSRTIVTMSRYSTTSK